MPRFIHTADLHINSLRRFNGYLDRVRGMLARILEVAVEERVDFIVVSGDIYDRLDITHSERSVLSEWLASSDIPIVLTSGNHDKRSGEVGDTALSYISSLSGLLEHHMIYDGIPTVRFFCDCYLVLIPYQGWMDQEWFLIMDSLLARTNNFDYPVIVMMHEAVYGCKTDTGIEVTKKNQIHLDRSFPGVTYWALGDIHMRQQMLSNAWYPGSPHQTNFGELPDKGVLLVDTDTPTTPTAIPISSVPLRVFEDAPEEGWPEDGEALVQFRPTSPVHYADLPANVEYHPSIVIPRQESSKLSSFVSLYDGLDEALVRAGLQRELMPLAWRTAVKMASDLGIETELPDRYKEPEIDE